MNITAQAAELKKLLKPFSLFSGKLLIETAKGTLTATDDTLFLSISSSIFRTDVAERVAVDIDKLAAIINRASGPVQIECAPGDYRLKIHNKSAVYDLVGSNAWYGEFPDLTNSEFSFELPTKALKQVTAFAAIASDASSRFDYVGSVQVQAIAATLKATGSDGVRLMSAYVPIPYGGKQLDYLELLIPLPGVKALAILDTDTVTVKMAGGTIFFLTPTITLGVKQLAKKFPSYQDLIPKDFEMVARVDAKEMAEALDRVAPMIAGDSKNRPVEMNFEASSLLLATHSDAGNAAETVALAVEKPDPLFDEEFRIVVRVNHEYLLDFFRAVAGPITIKASANRAPLLLEAEGKSLLVALIAGGSQ